MALGIAMTTRSSVFIVNGCLNEMNVSDWIDSMKCIISAASPIANDKWNANWC